MENNNVDNGNNQERLFTQSEVDELIGKRLEREKRKREAVSEDTAAQKAAELEARSAELDRREFLMDCKAFLRDNKMDDDLIDVISADDLEDFQMKAYRLQSIIDKKKPTYTPPMFVQNETGRGDIASAFSIDNKHKPRE